AAGMAGAWTAALRSTPTRTATITRRSIPSVGRAAAAPRTERSASPSCEVSAGRSAAHVSCELEHRANEHDGLDRLCHVEVETFHQRPRAVLFACKRCERDDREAVLLRVRKGTNAANQDVAILACHAYVGDDDVWRKGRQRHHGFGD